MIPVQPAELLAMAAHPLVAEGARGPIETETRLHKGKRTVTVKSGLLRWLLAYRPKVPGFVREDGAVVFEWPIDKALRL